MYYAIVGERDGVPVYRTKSNGWRQWSSDPLLARRYKYRKTAEGALCSKWVNQYAVDIKLIHVEEILSEKTDGRGGYRAKARRPLTGDSPRVTTSINIEERLLDKLDGLAASTGETRSDIINRLLRDLQPSNPHGERK